MQIRADLIEQAEECATPEELVALAKVNGMELTLDKAKEYMEFLNRDLSEDELAKVAGGSGAWLHCEINDNEWN